MGQDIHQFTMRSADQQAWVSYSTLHGTQRRAPRCSHDGFETIYAIVRVSQPVAAL
jgi:hypothetical protein